MSQLPQLALLLGLLYSGTATAEEPAGTPGNVDVKSLVTPQKPFSPRDLPKPLLVDGSSPVLVEQGKQKKPGDPADTTTPDATTTTTNGGTVSGDQVMLGSNIGAVPANYPSIQGAQTVEFNFPQGIDLMQLIKLMAQVTGRNFILGNDSID